MIAMTGPEIAIYAQTVLGALGALILGVIKLVQMLRGPSPKSKPSLPPMTRSEKLKTDPIAMADTLDRIEGKMDELADRDNGTGVPRRDEVVTPKRFESLEKTVDSVRVTVEDIQSNCIMCSVEKEK
jgi:hypothetical protein